MRKGDIFVSLILFCYIAGIIAFISGLFLPSALALFAGFLLFVLGGLGAFVLWIWMLVDLIQRPLKDKIVWALLLILVSGIASFIYYGLVYRKNLREETAGQSEGSKALLLLVVLVVAGLFFLIIIAIVVGVLVFIVSSPLPAVMCSSSDPTKIMAKVYNVSFSGSRADSMPLGTIKLVNLAGGEISSISCTGSNAFASNVPGCPSSVESGAEFALTPIAGSTGTHEISMIKMQYTDPFGTAKTVTISCSGPITIS